MTLGSVSAALMENKMRIVNIERILEAGEDTLTDDGRSTLVRFIKGVSGADVSWWQDVLRSGCP